MKSDFHNEKHEKKGAILVPWGCGPSLWYLGWGVWGQQRSVSGWNTKKTLKKSHWDQGFSLIYQFGTTSFEFVLPKNIQFQDRDLDYQLRICLTILWYTIKSQFQWLWYKILYNNWEAYYSEINFWGKR